MTPAIVLRQPPWNMGNAVRAIRTFKRYLPRMRQAVNRIKRAKGRVVTIQRAYRAYRGRNPRVVRRRGRISGSRNRSNRHQVFYNGAGLPDAPDTIVNTVARKNLWTSKINFARVDDTARRMGEVLGQKIFIKGIKICYHGYHLQEDFGPESNMMVHFALIQPKGWPDDAPFHEKFFSNPGGGLLGLDRAKDFPDTTTDPGWDPTVNCNGINPQRFNIITHMKRNIYPVTTGSGGNQKAERWDWEKYFPINKTLVYEDAESDVVDRPIVMAVWYERLAATAASVSVHWAFNVMTQTYFKSIV